MRPVVRRLVACFGLLLAVLLTASYVVALPDQAKDDALDIVHYKIEAEAIPDTHVLRGTAAVTFRLSKPSQSAIFEMNGSLKISKVTTADGRDLQFVQDTLDNLNVRIDLGAQVLAGQEMTLIFQYEGQLVSPQGGVLPNKRLAYIGPEGSYLTYASRWFPFHGYAADTATYEISLITPADLTVVGLSLEPVQTKPYVPEPVKPSNPATPDKTEPDQPDKKPPVKRPPTKKRPLKGNAFVASGAEFLPVSYLQPIQDKVALTTTSSEPRNIHTFVSKVPVLPGTFAIAKYIAKPVQSNNVKVEVYVKPGDEAVATKFGEQISQAVAFYNTKFGPYALGNRMVLAEIDNESLDASTGAGITLLSERLFKDEKDSTIERLYRETAYQWWGQSVFLKSFDEAWIAQGLAQFSAMAVEEANSSESAFREIARESMERALAFESQTSISRAPVELDDQSEAYRSIVFYKGAFVYRMLRLTIGEEKFDTLLKTYYEQYKGKPASIDDFEAVATKVAGRDLRFFFGQWIDSTGVPEFTSNYQIIRTKDGGFKVRGSINQEMESFNMPVEVEVVYEGSRERSTINLAGKSADFSFVGKGKPQEVIVDPDSKLLKISDNIRVSVVVRRGIEHFRNEEYPEAEQQFLAAIKLNRSSSWAWYNLGLLYFAQKNFQKANDTFSEALELDLQPRWVEVWSYIKRGNCYDALGQRDRAVAEYQKAIQIGDNYENAQAMAQQYLSAPYKRNQTEQSKAD